MYWFLSDTHFGHENIIIYCARPFKNVKEMDEVLIKNINERVGEDDTLFFLGDFCMKRSSEASNAPQNAFDYYRNQIKCKNIVFITGNHDHNNGTKTPIESMIIKHGGIRIHLTHNPKHASIDFKFNFCGHVHEKWQFQKLGKKSIIINLSVEKWEYRPVDINEIFQAYSIWSKSKKNEKTN
jgi:calcineurin-like phosphoesterase family protein